MKIALGIISILACVAFNSALAATPTLADCQKAWAKCPSHPGNQRCKKVLPKCEAMKTQQK